MNARETPFLRIDGLNKRFDSPSGPFVALSEVSLDVAEHEFVAMVGASGCGKSTLLRIVAGLDAPSEGEIWLDGGPVLGPGMARAMVFQDYTLFPWLTVKENIAFSRSLAARLDYATPIHKMEAMVDRMRALIQIMGLEGVEDSYPNQLSGGMRQRAAIARALLSRPEVLLMDEPFGALDAQTREVMHDLLQHVFALEKTTVLFVTHDVEEAIYLSRRVVVLAPRPGRVDCVFDVDFPPEREPDLKLEPDFIALKREIVHRIRETSGMATDRAALGRVANA